MVHTTGCRHCGAHYRGRKMMSSDVSSAEVLGSYGRDPTALEESDAYHSLDPAEGLSETHSRRATWMPDKFGIRAAMYHELW